MLSCAWWYPTWKSLLALLIAVVLFKTSLSFFFWPARTGIYLWGCLISILWAMGLQCKVQPGRACWCSEFCSHKRKTSTVWSRIFNACSIKHVRGVPSKGSSEQSSFGIWKVVLAVGRVPLCRCNVKHVYIRVCSCLTMCLPIMKNTHVRRTVMVNCYSCKASFVLYAQLPFCKI